MRNVFEINDSQCKKQYVDIILELLSFAEVP